MNRQFALPAIVACSVHATLMFAFPKPPTATRTTPKEEKSEYVPWEIKKVEEKPEESPTDASTASSLGKPQLTPPSSPETPPATVSLNEFTMSPDMNPRSDLKVDMTKIPRGPFSERGGVGEDFGADKIGLMVINSSHLDQTPRTRLQASPAYPHAMKVAGITGEVIVEFTVDEGGNVLNPRVVRSTNREFEEPTLRAVAKWRFEPGTRHMKPVRFTMTVPVVFNVGD